MPLLICPGVHPPELTYSFLQQLGEYTPDSLLKDVLIFPSAESQPYFAGNVLQFIHQQIGNSAFTTTPLLIIGFSAGVVGAIGAAWGWQMEGGKVKALIALDGWGVPLGGSFPIHRLSHDFFTHWSSSLLGAGEDSFYADPSVEHLDLWRSPQTALGWQITPLGERFSCNGAEFLAMLLKRYTNSLNAA